MTSIAYSTGTMDLNPLIRLKDALEGAQKNTSKMLIKLEKFDTKLTTLEEKMQPLQVSTSHYTRAKENIALTLVEVNKTYEYFRVANDVKDIINNGLNDNTQALYFNALSRLSHAKNFFESHLEIKSATSALASIDILQKNAVTTCVQEFERILLTAGKSIILNSDKQFNIINPLTLESSKSLKAICEVLESNRYDDHFKVYERVRSAKLKAELKELETTHSKEWSASLLDSPYEKGSHPFRGYFHLVYWLLRSELQLWGSTLPSTQESLQIFVSICEAVVNDLQTVLKALLSDDSKSSSSSSKSMNAVNPVVSKSKWLLIRLDVLETFHDRYEELRELCRPDIRHENNASLALTAMRQSIVIACVEGIDFLASYHLSEGFIIVEGKQKGSLQQQQQQQYEHVFDPTSCDLHPSTGNVMYCCQEILKYNSVYRRMRDLINSINVSSLIPQGKFMEVPQMILNPTTIPVETDDFIMMVLENLYSALDERAKKFDLSLKVKSLSRELNVRRTKLFEYDDKSSDDAIFTGRKHLFMANNLFCVLQHAREIISDKDNDSSSNNNNNSASSGNTVPNTTVPSASSSSTNTTTTTNPSMAIVVNTNHTKKRIGATNKRTKFIPFIKKIEDRLSIEIAGFCDVICTSMGLSDKDMSDFENRLQTEKINSTTYCRLLKAKFSVFNTGMNSFLTQQGDWRIPSAGLREKISTILTKSVSSSYSTFFEKYSVVKFSKKHQDIYLRYPPQAVEKHIVSFFGRETFNYNLNPLKF